MLPLYVSFYTIGTPYEAEARALKETLVAFDLPYEIVGVPDAGDWVRNCALKPMAIQDIMGKHPGRPLVFLDADARVVQYPSIFDTLDCDFAAHWYCDRELISACMYFGPTDAAMTLVKRWFLAMKSRTNEWDQKVLQGIVESSKSLRVVRLPPEYNWIQAVDGTPDLSEQFYGKRDPVIVQRQASRRLRGR